MGNDPTLVLVHSPLVGATTWEPVAQTLRDRGHRVLVADLAAALRAGPPYYPGFARAVATQCAAHGAASTDEVVLVAHSGAGALLPTVADALSGPVRGAVFVDALLPHPGRSWFDTVQPELGRQLLDRATGGFLPPWSEWFPPGTIAELLPDAAQRSRFLADVPRLPVDYTSEVAPQGTVLDPRRCGYLQLSEAYTAEATQVAETGWTVHRRDTHHLALLTEPAGIASAVADLAAEVTAR